MQASSVPGTSSSVAVRNLPPPHCWKSRTTSLFLHHPNPLSFLKPSNSFGRFNENWRPTKARQAIQAIFDRVESSHHSDSTPVAPLQLKTPTGKLLVQLLEKHPHLVPAAVDQQLRKLDEERDGASAQEQPHFPGSDSTSLYRRIAELKAHERQDALKEIIYVMIVEKFVEMGVPMSLKVPSSSSSSSSSRGGGGRRTDFLLLEEVHSPEALELIKEHLSLILGGRAPPEAAEKSFAVPISRLKVGRAYGASVMFGYFLRRVDWRFQLEKSMRILSSSPIPSEEEEATGTGKASSQQQGNNINSVGNEASSHEDDDNLATKFAEALSVRYGNHTSTIQAGLKSARLRSYVMSLDNQTLYNSASIRSRESVGVIERHTEALFGRDDAQILRDGTAAAVDSGVIRLDLLELKQLVLEAVAFGAFLWDVECYADSQYRFLTN